MPTQSSASSRGYERPTIRDVDVGSGAIERMLADPSVPAALAGSPAKLAELAELSIADRKLITAETLARWTGDLVDDDYTLAEVVRLEKRRRANLTTIRQGAELTDMEWRLWRYLVKHAGRVRTYVQMANHLYGTAERPITPRLLRSADGFENIYLQAIRRYVAKLRHKIEIDPIRPQHLASVRGVGYCWYDAPPSISDGINYERRAAVHARLRVDMLGLLNPTALPAAGEQPDEYLDADVVDAVSVADDDSILERHAREPGAEIRSVMPGPEFDRIVNRRRGGPAKSAALDWRGEPFPADDESEPEP